MSALSRGVREGVPSAEGPAAHAPGLEDGAVRFPAWADGSRSLHRWAREAFRGPSGVRWWFRARNVPWTRSARVAPRPPVAACSPVASAESVSKNPSTTLRDDFLARHRLRKLSEFCF